MKPSILLAALLLGNLQSPPSEFKGIYYTNVKGWTLVPDKNYLIFNRDKVPTDKFLTIILVPPIEKKGVALKEIFGEVAKQMNADSTITKAGQLQESNDGVRHVVAQDFREKDKDVGEMVKIITGVEQGDKCFFVTLLVSDSELLKANLDDVTTILNSMRLTKELSKPSNGLTVTPTGSTPGMFPGTPGWLPSGKGVKIPESKIVGGKPVGIWYSLGSSTQVRAFLEGGLIADYIIYGSGTTVDIAAHKAKQATSLGTYSVSGGKLNISMDGRSSADTFKVGSDSFGPYFDAGGAAYRPGRPSKMTEIAGVWRNGSTQYEFKPDGTFKFGQAVSGQANGVSWVESSTVFGPFLLDGYLLTTKDNVGHLTIQAVVYVSKDVVLINDFAYRRVK